MALIYHLAKRSEWEEAGSDGPYSAGSLAEEGFIHCSRDEEQMLAVATAFSPAWRMCWCWTWTRTG